MKQYIHTTSTYLLLLLLTGTCLLGGCSGEEAIGPGKKADDLSLSIVANVNTSVQTRATDDPAKDVKNQNGSWIKTLAIFLFAPGASDSSTPLLTKTVEVSGLLAQRNQANQIQLTGKELSNAGIGAGSHVQIYAIANYNPSNAGSLSKKQMKELFTTTLPNYESKFSWGKVIIPMTGVSDYEITSNNEQTLSIAMKRAVIRITVDITDAEFNEEDYITGSYNWNITSVKFYNDYASTYLWKEGIPATPGYRSKEKAIGPKDIPYTDGNSVSLDPFYLNCNEASATGSSSGPIKVIISGSRTNANSIETPFEYTIDLKKEDGNYLFERNTSLTASLTLNAGSVTVKTEALPWDQEVSIDNDEKLMRPEPKANSYIVKPETTILIPVSQVQDVNAFNSSYASAITPNETLTAELVWTDVKGASSNKGLADDASIAEIEIIGKGPEALLRILTGTETGSSVVAIKSGGTFKWSWHIWVTDYNPEATNFTSGSYTFMDRNLGARSNTPDNNGHNSTGVVGAYYQWGRPAPLPSKPLTSTSTVTIPATIYDAAGNQVSRSTTSNINDIGNPIMFFPDFYSGQLELWNTNGRKTPLDPCPAGWRVPVKEAWDNVVFESIKTAGVQSNAGFYPTSQAYMDVNGIKGWFKPFFWTATTGAEGLPYGFTAGSSTSTTGRFAGNNDFYASSVRCVKE